MRENSSRFDVVTDADKAAERAISTALEAAYAAAVVGEEAAGKNPAILDAIDIADVAFVLDPLDGTKNFPFATSEEAVSDQEPSLVGGMP
ncbi:inositol monophosphatase family protein [Azospirillum argentinense]